MSTVVRGSRCRLAGHLRPTALLTASAPSSVLIHTIVLWTEPSWFRVESAAWLGASRSFFTSGSFKLAMRWTVLLARSTAPGAATVDPDDHRPLRAAFATPRGHP